MHSLRMRVLMNFLAAIRSGTNDFVRFLLCVESGLLIQEGLGSLALRMVPPLHIVYFRF